MLKIVRSFLDEIAVQFLLGRRPDSKNHEARVPYLRTYILEEFPIFLTGVEYKGKKYQTMLYPTAAACKCFDLADLIYEVQTSEDYEDVRKDILGSSTTTATNGQVLLPLPISNVQEMSNVKRFYG